MDIMTEEEQYKTVNISFVRKLKKMNEQTEKMQQLVKNRIIKTIDEDKEEDSIRNLQSPMSSSPNDLKMNLDSSLPKDSIPSPSNIGQ